MANQNSISPKILTEIRFTVSTTASAISASTHCGTSVNRPPVVGVDRDRGDVGDAGGRPVEEVHPAGDVRALLAEELPGVGDEGAGGRPVQDELAERAHDEEGEEPADGVGDGQGRAGLGEAAAGAEEEAGADGAADGDHVDVPGLQRLAVARVSGVGVLAWFGPTSLMTDARSRLRIRLPWRSSLRPCRCRDDVGDAVSTRSRWWVMAATASCCGAVGDRLDDRAGAPRWTARGGRRARSGTPTGGPARPGSPR